MNVYKNCLFPLAQRRTRTDLNSALRTISTSELIQDLRCLDQWKRRRALSRAITLTESRAPAQQQEAARLLTTLLQEQEHRTKPSFRIGIAGPPGAGKSTIIETLGTYVLDSAPETVWQPNQLAVICIDPSSTVTGGSILGDKTRMTALSRHAQAFVRPAPSKGAVGGLAAYTDDVVSVCQAAGYDAVWVETVGLGQSETEVAQSVDMMILLIPPGGGDDLQGTKKGILEVADLVVVTKADWETQARRTAAEYEGALQFLRTTNRLPGWERPPVVLASAVTHQGIPKLWEKVSEFRQGLIDSGLLEIKRARQRQYWMWKNLQTMVQERVQQDAELKIVAQRLGHELDQGRLTPRVAALELFQTLTHSSV